jgi:hypothetical protein
MKGHLAAHRMVLYIHTGSVNFKVRERTKGLLCYFPICNILLLKFVSAEKYSKNFSKTCIYFPNILTNKKSDINLTQNKRKQNNFTAAVVAQAEVNYIVRKYNSCSRTIKGREQDRALPH